MKTTTKAALYVRVSTDKQTTANQLTEVRQLAEARGWEGVVYEETESAAKRRPVFEQMLSDARAGRVRAIVVWRLDRLHRSMLGAITDVLALDGIGVQVVSVRETWLDTNGPVRPLLLAIFGWVAEQERNTLIDRTRAGLARARAEGKRLGRPRASSVLVLGAVDRVERGMSVSAAAAEMGVSRATLQRALADRRRTKGAAPSLGAAPLPKNPA